jgi:hypothetical protein
VEVAGVVAHGPVLLQNFFAILNLAEISLDFLYSHEKTYFDLKTV